MDQGHSRPEEEGGSVVAYHGVSMDDPMSSIGRQMIRKNPKRKRRLAYHQARRNLRPQVMGGSQGCIHSLAQHQEVGRQSITFALPCTVKQHKSKTPIHKDTTGRKWK